MIYVDALEFKKPNGKKAFCHMFADSLEELHRFAEAIGRKPCWFHRSTIVHYDLDQKFREIAVAKGAIEIDTKDAIMANRLKKTIDEYLSLHEDRQTTDLLHQRPEPSAA